MHDMWGFAKMKIFFNKGDVICKKGNEMEYQVVDFMLWGNSQVLKLRPTTKCFNDITHIVAVDNYIIYHLKEWKRK